MIKEWKTAIRTLVLLWYNKTPMVPILITISALETQVGISQYQLNCRHLNARDFLPGRTVAKKR